ncbi:hypothetical protein C8E83_2780 [Frondihabitans australicus]|uniref:Uncharacterized protein n=1 Tax=Frondihabitans australicus TaxID=386892 RepID=A0A495IHX3_9MICO|nr:hypothetical protein C8E83_2780 [Frondihabitans australicus]
MRVFTVVACVAMAIGVMTAAVVDEEVPLGGNSLVVISTAPKGLGAPAALRTVTRAFAAEGVAGALRVADNGHFTQRRTFVVEAGSFAHGLVPGLRYPDLIPGHSTRVIGSDTDRPADVQGEWVVGGSVASARDVAARLRSRGFEADASPLSARGLATRTALSGNAFLVLLVTVVAVIASVLSAVWRRTGSRPFGDASDIAPPTSKARWFVRLANGSICSALAVGGTGLVALWLAGRLPQAGRIFGVAGVAYATCCIVGLATLCAVSPRRQRGSAGTSLSEGRSSPALSTFTAFQRLASAALVTGLVAGTFTSATLVAVQLRGLGEWSHFPGAVSLRFASTSSDAELQARQSAFGDLTRDLEKRDLAFVNFTSGARPRFADDYTVETGNTLVVDQAFLAHAPIRDVGGRLVQAARQRVTVYLPTDAQPRESAWRKYFDSWVRDQMSIQGGRDHPDIPVSIRYLAGGAPVFHGGGSFDASQQYLHGPAVVVVPTNRPLLSDDFLLSAATSGQVMFVDSRELRHRLERSGITDLVLSIDAAGAVTREAVLWGVARSANGLLGAVLGFVSLATLTRLVAEMHLAANAGRLVARRRLGHSLLRIFGGYVTAPAILGALVVGALSVLGGASPSGAVIAALLVGSLAALTSLRSLRDWRGLKTGP